MGKVAELKQRRGQVFDQRKAIVDKAEAEDRDLTEAEQKSFDELGAKQEDLSARIQRLEGFDEEEPGSPVAAGIVRKTSPDAPGQGGVKERYEDDPKRGFPSQAAYFGAVLDAGMGRKVDPRIRGLWRSASGGGWETYRQTAGSDEHSGASDPYGGFMVPKGFSDQGLMIRFEGDPSEGRTRMIPMDTPKLGLWKRVDTTHATSVAGGIIVYRRSETGTVTAARAQLGEVELKAESLMGVSYATQELLSDSPRSWMAMIQGSYSDAFASRHLQEVIRGTGAGQFLGFINSPCLVTVNKESGQVADTLVVQNILKMRSRVWGYGNAVWMANPDAYPQLATMFISTNTGGWPVYQTSVVDDRPDTLLGRPIFYSDHMSSIGDLGDIACCNFGEYLEGEYQPMQQAESMHVRFVEHEGAFKFWKRNDGRPWWGAALTPKNGSNTRSPFVTLQAR
ncbi:MAG: phage major capsid protein [Phycisphaerales bacterium]|nr:phage major capsid protein [Phycisphaerales bacterium]